MKILSNIVNLFPSSIFHILLFTLIDDSKNLAVIESLLKSNVETNFNAFFAVSSAIDSVVNNCSIDEFAFKFILFYLKPLLLFFEYFIKDKPPKQTASREKILVNRDTGEPLLPWQKEENVEEQEHPIVRDPLGAIFCLDCPPPSKPAVFSYPLKKGD